MNSKEFSSCLSLKSETICHIIAVHHKGNFHVSSVTFWVSQWVSKQSPNPSKYNCQQAAAERSFERTVLTAWKGRNILAERWYISKHSTEFCYHFKFSLHY